MSGICCVNVDADAQRGSPHESSKVAEGSALAAQSAESCATECIGLHAAKRGTRFEALEPIRQGVRERFGEIGDGVARGLRRRHDHGSNYLADDFQQEVAFFGIESSPSFVREPEGNGVAERFIRTLKENLLWVRSFETIEELRLALLEFKRTYNDYFNSAGDTTVAGIWGGRIGASRAVFSAERVGRQELQMVDRSWTLDRLSMYVPGDRAGWSSLGNPGTFSVGKPVPFTADIFDPRCTDFGGQDEGSTCLFRYAPYDNLIDEQQQTRVFTEINGPLNARTITTSRGSGLTRRFRTGTPRRPIPRFR